MIFTCGAAHRNNVGCGRSEYFRRIFLLVDTGTGEMKDVLRTACLDLPPNFQHCTTAGAADVEKDKPATARFHVIVVHIYDYVSVHAKSLHSSLLASEW